jgi:hypothetical protein
MIDECSFNDKAREKINDLIDNFKKDKINK